jgi:anti-anti-sigma factor
MISDGHAARVTATSGPRSPAGNVPGVDLVCRSTIVGDIATLQLSGEIDLATIPMLRDATMRLVGSAPGSTVAIDLDGVTVVDDTGLGVLLGAAARARENGGDLILVCSSERLNRRFELSGLARAIEVRSRLAP